MKANELRLGNWIEYKKGHQGTVSAIDDQGYVEVNNSYLKDGVFELSQFQPIPLTEDWLLKFGFKKIGNCFHKIGFGFYAQKIKDSIGFHIKRSEISIEIEHVQQLQNLYFALTGEELKIEE